MRTFNTNTVSAARLIVHSRQFDKLLLIHFYFCFPPPINLMVKGLNGGIFVCVYEFVGGGDEVNILLIMSLWLLISKGCTN